MSSDSSPGMPCECEWSTLGLATGAGVAAGASWVAVGVGTAGAGVSALGAGAAGAGVGAAGVSTFCLGVGAALTGVATLTGDGGATATSCLMVLRGSS